MVDGSGAIGRDGEIRVELIERARGLMPLLKARADEGERLRRVPDASIADLVSSKLLRVCQPKRFGGAELGWDVLCELSVELARGDGSQAWVANIYGEHVYIVAMFEDRAQHDVWDENPDALICASVVPQGNRVVAVPGGYKLSGKWGFASGVPHADWIILGENTDPTPSAGDHSYFLVPRADYRILDDWFTLGMAGTGSCSVTLEDVFVPAHRVLSNRAVVAGAAPGAKINRAPLYRMPLMGFAQLALGAVVIGASAGMVDEWGQAIRSRWSANAGSVDALSLERFSESSAEVRSASLLLIESARENMVLLARGFALGEADAARSMRDSAFAIKLARQAAQRIFEGVGGRGQFLSSSAQRMFRNVLTGASHASLNWDRSAIRYAQASMAGLV